MEEEFEFVESVPALLPLAIPLLNINTSLTPKQNRQRSATSSKSGHEKSSIARRASISFLFKSKTELKNKYGCKITDYELLEVIGGIDDVSFLYLARHKPSLDMVSLKYTDLSISPDSEFVDEIIQSTRNSVLFRHPNILLYQATFIDDDKLWSVVQPMHFGSCRLIMKKRFPDGFSESAVATILKEVLKALKYLHSSHIIHK